MEFGKRYYFENNNKGREVIEIQNTRNGYVEYKHVEGTIKGKTRIRHETFEQFVENGYFKEVE
jgi:hypothetical protein